MDGKFSYWQRPLHDCDYDDVGDDDDDDDFVRGLITRGRIILKLAVQIETHIVTERGEVERNSERKKMNERWIKKSSL